MRCLIGSLLIAAIAMLVRPVSAQPQKAADKSDGEAKPDATTSRFELKDGDRAVFIGNTFLEREGRYG